MNKEEPSVGNCPYCTKIVLKEGTFNSEGMFMTICPHCQKQLKVIMQKKIQIIILPAHHLKKAKANKLPEQLIVIFVLILPTFCYFLEQADVIFA